MIVHSEVLGTLTLSEDDTLRFPTGLFGLPESRHFALLPAERDGLFWLQSLESSALTFLLVDPFLHFVGYSVDVTPADLIDLEANDVAEVAILAIVTLPRSREEKPTANLQGPLALNLRSRRGKQIAVQDTEFDIRAPFDLLSAPGAG